MIEIDLINARKVFDEEVNYQIEKAVKNKSIPEKFKTFSEMSRKVSHTDSVISYGLKVADELGFNESVRDFTHIALMDHDIGCFAQIARTGCCKDYILEKTTPFKNHGELGEYKLENIIGKQLPNAEIFHSPIRMIVREHVDKKVNDEELMILINKLLSNYSMEEILTSKSRIKKDILSAITQIVQDLDKLEGIYQILNEQYEPTTSKSKIDPKVFEMFYKGEYLSIKQLKKQGLWNSQVIELVRLSLFNHIKLLSVAKVMQEENLIMELKRKRNNPKMLDAYDYAYEKFNEMIKNTPDGVTLGKIR